MILAGCTAPARTPPVHLTSDAVKSIGRGLVDKGYKVQGKPLLDGSVTAEEYRTAFDNLRTCVTTAGYTISDPVVSPVTNTNYEFVFDFKGRNQRKANTEILDCEKRYWSDLAGVYVDTAPQRMDEGLRQAVIACMKKHHYRVPDTDRTIAQMAGRDPVKDAKRRTVTMNCTQSEATRLFPNLPSVSLSF